MSAPDIVLLVIDALRADAVRGDGPFEAATSTLDRLKEESVSFASAIAQSGHTRGSVPALMAGGYPLVDGLEGALPAERPVLPEVLCDAGYTTAAVHCNPFLSRAFGFDRGFGHFDDSAGSSNRLLVFLRRCWNTLSSKPYVPGPELVRRALDRVRQTPQPFFLWLHLMDVHGPYLPHADVGIGRRRAARLWRRSIRHPGQITPEDRNLMMRLYAGEVAFADRCVADFLAGLRSAVDADGTVLAVTADHGEQFLEHGMYNHPRHLYDEQVRVPLLLRGPGIRPADVSRQVQLLDLPSTLCRLAGAPVPACWRGQDLLEPSDPHRTAFSETTGYWETSDEDIYAVRTPERKYLSHLKDGSVVHEEGYDLTNDPGETRNVLAEQASDEAWKEMQRLLREHIESGDRPRGSKTRHPAPNDADLRRRLEALGYLE
jgi:arylsulfatase